MDETQMRATKGPSGFWQIVDRGDRVLADGLTEGNAAEMVRRCNAFPALVEALRLVDETETSEFTRDIWVKIEKALKLAGEGDPRWVRVTPESWAAPTKVREVEPTPDWVKF